MRNRAKCALCASIIESFHRHDYVECECKQISIDGGSDYFYCAAKDFKNFIRIDDCDKEVPTKLAEKINIDQTLKESVQEYAQAQFGEITKGEKLKWLHEHINNTLEHIEKMPPNAMMTPMNQYDYSSLLLTLRAFLEVSCIDDI